MSFASDKLYKGYLRRNMPTIATKVKVREIMAHLPCLTDHDRENIEAKRETYGNHDSMLLLLDCLKRRENWPEQFIEGLEACEHTTLAAEIRAEYNSLKNINNPSPSSPPTNVIKAHVHPPPPASHLPVPESDGATQAAVTPPAEPSAPPEPAAQASAPLEVPVQPQVPQISAAKVPEAVSPPEPPRPAQVKEAPPPATPPPSPEIPQRQVTATPPPQKEIHAHQEPVENSESDLQGNFGDNGVTPDQLSTGNGKISTTVADALPTTTTNTTEVRPPRSPSPTHIHSDVTDGSTFLIKTPEKPPVQDTTPPVDVRAAAAMQPEETSDPPATQVIRNNPQTETAATTSPPPGAAGVDAALCDDSSVCLSKPGQLLSVHPQNNGSPTIPAPSSPEGPYSGDSGRLEMSDAVTNAPACSAVNSTTVNTTSALPCQENGIALNHNEPEENQYESLCESLQEVRMNVIQISEEPSVLDLDGQSSAPQAQIVNGEAAKEITSAPPLSSNPADTVSGVSNPTREQLHPSEPATADTPPGLKTRQDSQEKNSSRALPTNTKYILTAAGVGACALLMAWKFKN